MCLKSGVHCPMYRYLASNNSKSRTAFPACRFHKLLNISWLSMLKVNKRVALITLLLSGTRPWLVPPLPCGSSLDAGAAPTASKRSCIRPCCPSSCTGASWRHNVLFIVALHLHSFRCSYRSLPNSLSALCNVCLSLS